MSRKQWVIHRQQTVLTVVESRIFMVARRHLTVLKEVARAEVLWSPGFVIGMTKGNQCHICPKPIRGFGVPQPAATILDGGFFPIKR